MRLSGFWFKVTDDEFDYILFRAERNRTKSTFIYFSHAETDIAHKRKIISTGSQLLMKDSFYNNQYLELKKEGDERFRIPSYKIT